LNGTYSKKEKCFFTPKVDELRALFAFWIQQGFDKSAIPEGISNELKKDLLSPDTMPPGMKSNQRVKELIEERKKIWEKMSWQRSK
jgi:hypothetical protein